MVRYGIIRRAADLLREQGIRGLWFAILERTGYRRVICVERNLNEPIPEIMARLPIVVGFLQESEVKDYVNLYPKADALEVRRKLKRGDLCTVARHKGQIVSCGWASTCGVFEYLGHEISLGKDEVYVCDGFTAPRLRGLNIWPVRSTWMLRYLRECGYKRVIGFIAPENRSSLCSCRKVGYRPFAVMGYVKLGPLRWTFRTCLSRKLSRSYYSIERNPRSV